LDLELKQKQFNAAMELYTGKPVYKSVGRTVSTVNVFLQIYLLIQIAAMPIDPAWQIIAIFLAFILADFVNGLVHLYMDNNDSYESIAGPFIANFHLHHKKPMYRRHPLLLVYFNETGSKIWLVGYLILVSLLLGAAGFNPVVMHILVYAGILSSVAEVSHYLCHTSNSSIAMFLGRTRLLLPKRHHAKHHMRSTDKPDSRENMPRIQEHNRSALRPVCRGGFGKSLSLGSTRRTCDPPE